MKNKIVIFDLDGVLVDSVEMGRESILYQYPGVTPNIHKDLHNGNFHEELSKLDIPKRAETEEEETLRKQNYAKIKSEAPFYEGMIDLLKELHANKNIIALNTSAYNRACLPCLENRKITHLFDFIGTADVSKSKVEKFKLIKEKYGGDFNEMIFVTDTLGDLCEAHEVGVPTVGVTWGVHDGNDFSNGKYDNLVGLAHSTQELKIFCLLKQASQV